MVVFWEEGDMKKLIIIISIVFSLAYGSRVVAAFEQGAGIGTTSIISCATSTTVIDVRDTRRFSFIIQNKDTTNPVTVCFSTTCATTTGTTLDPGTTNGKNAISNSFAYEWVGPLSCIATGGASNISFQELTK